VDEASELSDVDAEDVLELAAADDQLLIGHCASLRPHFLARESSRLRESSINSSIPTARG
jgi:hypothetical protein